MERINITKEQIKSYNNKILTLQDIQLKIQSEFLLLQKGFDKLLCLEDINIEPKPWQTETALKVLRDMLGTGLLADEVGLGKTIEAGLIVKELTYRGLINSALILVPAPLVDQWLEEMEDKFNLNFYNTRDENWKEHHFLVSSLPLAVRSDDVREELQSRYFDLVIVDEAHSLKNHLTKTYKFIYKLQRKNTILMSATPIQNNLEELYNLINILKPGYLQSKKKFRENYLKNKYQPKNVTKLRELLSEVMIRHRRKDTLTELTRRISRNLVIEPTDKERFFYNKVIDFSKVVFQEYGEKVIKVGRKEYNVLVLLLLSLLKQNCSSPQSVIFTLKNTLYPKLNVQKYQIMCKELVELGESIEYPSKAIKLLEEVKSFKEQCIVFTEYKETIALLEKLFEENNIKVLSYHGGLTPKKKKIQLEKFKNGDARILILSESGGQGLNIQYVHKLYNYDIPWNPMRIEQRIGRVHRFGQKHDVEITSLTTRGTLEEYILFILVSKLNLFEMVIGEVDTIMSYMLDSNENIDVQIGKIILKSKSSKEIEDNLRKIGEHLIVAKNDYQEEIKQGTKILNQIGVG